jgi:mRNA interferase HigB
MRNITERKLKEFWESADGAEKARRQNALTAWMAVVRKADWRRFADIRQTFNHSDIYGSFTIFDVGGNKYRVVAKVAFGMKALFIRAVLTHAEYDRKDWQPDCK